MLNIRGVKVYTQDELMDNLAEYIRKNVGGSDQIEHIENISGYVASMIGESEYYVNGYLKKLIKSA